MPRCIYCLEEKPSSAFNREHVIPQSYSRFDGDNLVLTCVCTSCNKTFGDTIDLTLARDTLEGIDRVRAGVKPAKEFKTLGARSRTRVEFKEGPMRGAIGRHVVAPNGSELVVEPVPQIGFAKSRNEEFKYYPLDEVPTQDELKELTGAKKGEELFIATWGMPIPDAIVHLTAKGYTKLTDSSEVPLPKGAVRMETIGTIDSSDFRVMTKIALNYLAATTSPAIARLPAFNDARRFARYDIAPPKKLVSISVNQWSVMHEGKPANGHYISLSTRGDDVIIQISLLMRFRYVVTLARGGFSVSFPNIFSKAHFFDLGTKRVIEITPLPLTPLTADGPDGDVTLKPLSSRKRT